MHVAHIVSRATPDWGGAPFVALEYVREARLAGLDVSTWATGTEIDRVYAANYGWWDNERRDGQLHLFPISFPKSWHYSPDFHRAFTAAAGSIDLIHLHQIWDYPLWAAAKVAREKGIPTILTPHGNLDPWRLGKKKLKKAAYMNLIGKRLLRQISVIHALTEHELRCLRLLGLDNRVEVIPNGFRFNEKGGLPEISTEEFQPMLHNKRIALFLARIESEKGLDLLLHAWKRERPFGWILIVAGSISSSYAEKMIEKAKDLGLSDCVVFPGLVLGTKKTDLFLKSEMFILPSKSEGFSMTILEAMASGLPVLITSECYFSEVSEAEAGLEVPATVEGIQRGLSKLCNMSKEKLREIGKRGEKLVEEKYSWSKSFKQMLNVYKSLLPRK